ncbi:MAG: methyltransferase [Bacteroidaceae bacterium]|nr:methyltransferase [Bacteroidaceae bacterium]
MKTFELIAKTFQGLEEVLAKELTELGADDIQIGRRMVSFTGDKRMMYRANFHLRTAIRVLKPILHFNAKDADEIYDIVKKRIQWEDYMTVNTSFAVDSVVYSDEFRHSKFVAYRVKDAIADYFREKEGKRPSVQVTNPDITLHIHIAQERCTLSLDSSGESLHRRGYRQEAVEAPLNEVLAAGMLLQTGWKGETDFVDPMCGSGTLPIEAALIARNIAPGVFRKEFAFEKWADFDQEMFDEIYNDDSAEREFEHHIYGYDIDWKAVNIATNNVRAAGLSKDITIERRDMADFVEMEGPALMVTNPPYGERITTDDLLGLYRTIGERLKHAFKGNDAWVLSYRKECFDKIGLKASVIIPLYNGALPCEMRKYELFDGKFKEFRESGEELDKSERPTAERRPLREREERAAKAFGMKREEERPRRRFNDDNRGFGDDRRKFGDDNRRFNDERRPMNKREMAERNDRERYEEDTNYSNLYERHHEFAKLQAARERKARPQGEKREFRGGEKRDFRGGKPAGDKRGQRAQRFSGGKPGFNKGRGGKKREE